MIERGDIHIRGVDVLVSLMERRYAPLLIEILSMIARRWGVEIIRAYRPKQHMHDLHGCQPGREIDLECWCYGSDRQAYEICHDINRVWQYDPARPEKLVASISDAGDNTRCIHIRVTHNTTRRAPSWTF